MYTFIKASNHYTILLGPSSDMVTKMCVACPQMLHHHLFLVALYFLMEKRNVYEFWFNALWCNKNVTFRFTFK